MQLGTSPVSPCSRGWGCSEAGVAGIGLVWKWHQLDTFFAISEGFVDLSSEADDIGPVTGDTDAPVGFLTGQSLWGTVWLYSKKSGNDLIELCLIGGRIGGVLACGRDHGDHITDGLFASQSQGLLWPWAVNWSWGVQLE